MATESDRAQIHEAVFAALRERLPEPDVEVGPVEVDGNTVTVTVRTALVSPIQDESALWTEAIEAFATSGHDPAMLRAGAEGHRNRRHIVQACLADVTGCPCGEDEPCPGVDTPERERAREALQRLSDAIGVPERIERGNSPP